VSLPLQTSFAYVTPKVGMHMTHYNFDNTNTGLGDQNRLVPIFSADSGVVFERDMQISGQSMVQTIEPKIFYVYIPTRNQNSLPVFDSALQNTNFATLYTENQFSGSDRINDANQVTTGVTSRLLQSNGVERLRAGIAQRFYFKTQEVTLPGVAPRGSNTSDLLAALNGLIVQDWFADAGFQYTTNQSQTQRINAGLRYEPERGKVVNVAYRYTNGSLVTATGTPTTSSPDNPSNTLRQADISTQWPISRHLTLIGRMNYSIADSRLLEGLAGLELNGVSKIGSNPLELLRRNIGGYYRGAPQVPRNDDNSFPLR
jgi:LPS-assembly protein